MCDSYKIDFEPLGRRGRALPGQKILEVAQAAGVGIASVCGGAGTCQECRIRLVEGILAPPTLVEQSALNTAELSAGFRLACQAEPLSDTKFEIPPDSLTTTQRLQLEGQETSLELNPGVNSAGAYGLAVDIGTTKLAAYLVRLQTGETVARAGAMNPQIAYGEDIISRIAYIDREAGGARRLQEILIENLNVLIATMCSNANTSQEKVLDVVMVGNTAMHHIAAGLPVAQLGRAPFSPATTAPVYISADTMGLKIGPSAKVYFPPVIAGYVGADHIAMLLATEAWKSKPNMIALDIGTNTEISLITKGKICCCSCASGPAFEGAHIREGMRAAPGAIERARWSSGRILWQTIDGLPPIGICGSGILDVVAAFQDGKLIKPTGAFQDGVGSEYVLVPKKQTGHNRDLVITRRDIHEVQLAKAAIRAGTDSLLNEAGLNYMDLDKIVVAGAFGTYLDIRSAVRVGMFPPLPLDRYEQIGNAAGIGAKQMLVSVDERQEAEKIARKIGYLELTTTKDFTDTFIKNIILEV
jgi:uncharacterized 2Fe-2S/4Fe-4S cluster protein (DUF4445 family)